ATPGQESVPSEELRGTETILLVEDDPTVRVFAGRVLRDRGYAVIEAGNGDEALLVAKNHAGPIDLVVTDIVMPRMGGLALAESLAALRPEAKVLYMSGYTDDMVGWSRALQSGAAFLQKPFTPEVLALKARAVLDAPKKAPDGTPAKP
ncbi:MAG: response regulator, partial [Nitrospirae bacterium]|nr:response regulator [Nitrospirota bacterium]